MLHDAAGRHGRVIKIEHRTRRRHAHGASVGRASGAREQLFLSINRNKESVALDFKPERAVRSRPVDRGADVLVENFRPGTSSDWTTRLCGETSRLIYVTPGSVRRGRDRAGGLRRDGAGGRRTRGVTADPIRRRFISASIGYRRRHVPMQGVLLAVIARATTGRVSGRSQHV